MLLKPSSIIRFKNARIRCLLSSKLHQTNNLPSTQELPKDGSFDQEFKTNFIELSQFQRVALSIGSAAISLMDPYRGDMIACLGEVTGESALIYMREQMLKTEEGADILRNRPRINSKTLDYERLSKLPDGTVGKMYSDFLIENGVTADSRLPVQFIKDVELGYVMQRYREVHDLVHACLGMKTTMLGEVTIKWVEGLQTRLPMCIGGGIFGAVRLKPKHRLLYLQHYLPWAIETGTNASFLQGIYFEKRWEQPIEDFYSEMNITKLLV